jgi:hypothetical protein
MRADPKGTWPTGSIVPLWSRQIPYTMAKFYFFEMVKEAFYKNVFTEPKETYGKSTHLSITFASGYIAGVACAIVSHPADTVVSKVKNNIYSPRFAFLFVLRVALLSASSLWSRSSVDCNRLPITCNSHSRHNRSVVKVITWISISPRATFPCI